MVPTPACCPQGVWTAKVRHGQAVLHQHPRPWHRQTLKPSAQDVAVDGAQLAVLLQQGASLADVADACARQPGACQKEDGWAKVLTSGVSIATGATTLWGCTPLTWDPQYPQYVSPDEQDAGLGARTITQELGRVGTDAVILLDAFSLEQQK